MQATIQADRYSTVPKYTNRWLTPYQVPAMTRFMDSDELGEVEEPLEFEEE